MPALHPRDGIGLHREAEILVHAGVVPPDASSVGVAAVGAVGMCVNLKPAGRLSTYPSADLSSARLRPKLGKEMYIGYGLRMGVRLKENGSDELPPFCAR